MKKICLLGAALGCLLVFAGSAWGVEIFYPSDKTVVRNANYLIVRGEAPQLEAMVLAFNGLRSAPINVGDPNYRRVFKDLLIIPSPPFELGRNEIVVEGYVGGKLVRSAQASIYYQPDLTVSAPAGFQPFVMHVPEREAKCTECHVMQIDEAQMSISDAAQNPCISCHKVMVKEKYVHGPVGSFSCGDCHTLATSGQKYPVTARGAELCNECHDDKTDEYKSNKYVHGPVAVGLCGTCHDPHGSGERGQLHEKVNRMCLGCHEQVVKKPHVLTGVTGKTHPFEAKKDPSDPTRRMTCVSCHDPHASNVKYFMAGGVTSRWGLCRRCHTNK